MYLRNNETLGRIIKLDDSLSETMQLFRIVKYVLRNLLYLIYPRNIQAEDNPLKQFPLRPRKRFPLLLHYVSHRSPGYLLFVYSFL